MAFHFISLGRWTFKQPSSLDKLDIEKTGSFETSVLNLPYYTVSRLIRWQFSYSQQSKSAALKTLLHKFFSLGLCGPTRAMSSSFLRFLDHTQRRVTFGTTPLDAWLVRRRDLYLTAHNTHNREIHALGGIRIHNLSGRAAVDLCLILRGYWDRHTVPHIFQKSRSNLKFLGSRMFAWSKFLTGDPQFWSNT